MTKAALRREYKMKRDALGADDIAAQSLLIANAALNLPIWHHQYFHVFLTIAGKKEVDTEYLLHVLSGKDKQIVVSKSDLISHTMSHFLLTDTTQFEVNEWDIPEPKNGQPVETRKIDVVFVPLLAFDLSGQRVGYGKGFYDKFLSECRADAIKIGLSFFDVTANLIEDISEKDIRLDYCITPQRVYSF